MTPRTARIRRAAVASLAAATWAGVLAASAGAVELPSQISSNWAGYAAITGRGTHAFAKRFTSVSGTWVQPTATCVPGQPTFSAFWVGLGGYKVTSQALEQVGSEADCSAAGVVSYYAWFEYVPAGPRNIKAVPINAGDTITASVQVAGAQAAVTLTDVTSGATYTRTKRMRSPRPDVSAAEWIAEAPSNCNANNCRPLTLTNFGTVNFTNASATSVGFDGVHTGVIDDPAWIYGQIDLQSGHDHAPFGHELASSASAGALAATGDAFAVTYTGGQPPPPGPTGPSGPTGGTGTSGSSGATGVT